MKILVVTDAWHPQVNGVVRTYERLAAALADRTVLMRFLTPNAFHSIPCPGYSEIRLAIAGTRQVGAAIATHDADHIHIATEGPLGLAARRYCLRNGLPFSTCFHTRFPEYLRLRAPIPIRLSYAALRRFHGPASCVMVATKSLRNELAARGFGKLALWSRGVDATLFHPDYEAPVNLPRPVFAYVGRIAVEKNIDAFLSLSLPGSKLVVGDGPALAGLRERYPGAVFVGAKSGRALAAHYAMADVFVFPSLTDTFGNVILEALACGTPVAAFPVMGPRDLLCGTNAGVLHRDLGQAALNALSLSRDACRRLALTYSWENCAAQFLGNIGAAPPFAENPANPTACLRA